MCAVVYESVAKIFAPLKRAVYLAKENPLSSLTLIGIKGLSYIGNQFLTSKVMYCYECTKSIDLTKQEIFTVPTIKDSNYRDVFNYSN